MASPATGKDFGAAIGRTDAFTPEVAQQALAAACAAAGLDCGAAALNRLGSNAVFRTGTDIVARVGRSAGWLPQAAKQIAVARWLEVLGYPAVRAIKIDQPVVAEGRVVTFWASLSDGEQYAPIADVAALIRRLHELPPPDFELPPLQPFGGPDEPRPSFPGLSRSDESYMRDRYGWARTEVISARSA